MFTVDTILTPGLAQNSYLIAGGGQAFIIDPRRDIQIYLDHLAERGLALIGIADTHAHADYVSGAPSLAEATGARLYSPGMGLNDPSVAPQDGQVVLLGEAEVVMLHTPGHTPEHFAYYVSDRHDVAQPPALFSGDLIFVGDLGRPELLGADLTRELAPALYHTLWEKIRPLPGQTVLYPGHGAGSLCGKGLSSKPTSTLDEEFASSPALQFDNVGDFVKYMLKDQPRVPPHFLTMSTLNKQGAPTPLPFGAIPAVDAAAIRAALEDPAMLVLDGRSVEAFSQGHLAGSVSFPVSSGMTTWMGWLLNPGQRVLAIVESQGQAEELQRWMQRVGFDALSGYYLFDASEWAGQLQTLATIDPQVFDPSHVAGQLIDVRTPAEYAAGTLGAAQSIPLCELPRRLGELDKSAPITVFCQGGYRGTIAGSLLENAGFSDIANVSGGYSAVVKQQACAI